jgi:hypothetical protein
MPTIGQEQPFASVCLLNFLVYDTDIMACLAAAETRLALNVIDGALDNHEPKRL